MLENILIEYFGLKENWNEDFETQQDLWNASYWKLIDLIYELQELGALNNASKIVDELDKIESIEE